MKRVVERFLKYVKIDTHSIEGVGKMPSNENELMLANIIKEDLASLGIKSEIDRHGYLYATLSGNTEDAPPVGFIAHMDTFPDAPSDNVNPRIVLYKGGNIVLNEIKGIVLSKDKFPEIEKYKGQEIIVTDGTTLLGGDDKAGIAEIITAVEYLAKNPDIPHGDIRIAFTPDEEIGRGMDKFDPEKFGAEYAYTVDGGEVGGFEFENFNAASATFKIHGVNIHPGDAKGKMLNAIKLSEELISMFPQCESPECTEEYEGFYHFHTVSATVDSAVLQMLIRDHSKEKFSAKKLNTIRIVDFLNEKYGAGIFEVSIKDTYYNMKEIIDAYPEVVDIAVKAYKDSGIEPIIKPIRGGTDGACLSFMGIPTPNIFTGTLNEHSVYECVPVPSMAKAAEVLVNIAKEYVKLEQYIGESKI